jgi:hypothetical protein
MTTLELGCMKLAYELGASTFVGRVKEVGISS